MTNPSPFLVANLKANKNWQELSAYLEEISSKVTKFIGTIVVCPSSPFLAASSQKIRDLDSKIAIGSQDISKFETGPYTGEFSVSQIKDICAYSIIGHSERKKYFKETTEDVLIKIDLLLKSQITPILCIASRDELETYGNSQIIQSSSSKIIFVHEPPGAISAQKDYVPEDPTEANRQAGKIKEKFSSASVLYGGSVNSQNAGLFLSQENIDGALIGQASLQPQEFLAIIK